MRGELARESRGLGVRRLARLALATAPPALLGYAFEREIEERLGSPAQVAAAQVAAGTALLVADRMPDRRARAEAGELDHLLLGVAQASALVPGVSRTGAMLTVARLRGLRRAEAARLARLAGLPIVAGAVALKGARLVASPPSPAVRGALAAGAVAAFASTVASTPLARRLDRAGTLAPLALYRIGLGVATLAFPLRHSAWWSAPAASRA